METEQISRPEEIAYPPALKNKELAIWRIRKELNRTRPNVGFALSGGGIRSATFCLGVFQALAKQPGLLRKIDYISSVSGGSFFASFYGRLFSRDDIDRKKTLKKPDGSVETLTRAAELPIESTERSDVEKILSPDSKIRLAFPNEKWKTGIFGWLRENGRYLAPNGSGDTLNCNCSFSSELDHRSTVSGSQSTFTVFSLTTHPDLVVRCPLGEPI